MTTVQQLMKTQVLSTRSSSTIHEAFAQMTEAGVRHLPVVDEQGRLTGIVSQRDIGRALDLARATGPREMGFVGDVMRKDVLKATPTLPAAEAAAMMIEHKIGALPVVSAEDRLVGLLTETDFLEIAREALLGIAPGPRART